MKLPKYLICLLVLLQASVAIAQNKTVYFPYFELINVDEDPGLQYSTSKLLKSYVENNHKYTIVIPEREGKNYFEKESLNTSMENAQKYSAKYVLHGEIHSLQGVFIISLGLYNAKTGEQVWHDLAKGSVQEDLDPLLSRLGRTFMSEKTAKTDIEIDEVTSYDEKGVELSQIKVNHFIGAMLGGKYLFGERTISGFGLAYTYDASIILFNLNFEFYPSSTLPQNNNSLIQRLQHGNFTLGAMYPLSRKRMTAYLDGGLEYGFLRAKEDIEEAFYTETGIGVYVGGGYLVNRNSTVNLRVYGAISVPLYSIQGQSFPGFKFGIVTSFAR